jgi:DNA end-binding protein Ku
MPRSIWNGTISFGLVHVPVKLYSATESKTVHFSEVHLKDGSKVEHKRFCSKEDKEVPYEQVVKGYEVSSNKFVVLEKDEVKAAAGDRGRIVEVDHFVCADDIDPVFYEKAYYLGPRDGGEDAYRLLRDALDKAGRAAIGRFTFHNREYLAAIRPFDDKVLSLHTMRFHDEVATADEFDVDAPSKAPAKKEVDMAARLVDSLYEEFDATAYEDEYRAAVLDLIDRKASGKQIEAPEDEPEESNDDLMAALEASMADGPSRKRDKSKARTAKSKSRSKR